jgi:hypothetical protein
MDCTQGTNVIFVIATPGVVVDLSTRHCLGGWIPSNATAYESLALVFWARSQLSGWGVRSRADVDSGRALEVRCTKLQLASLCPRSEYKLINPAYRLAMLICGLECSSRLTHWSYQLTRKHAHQLLFASCLEGSRRYLIGEQLQRLLRRR